MTKANEIVIENVAHIDNFYVWTQQRTSYNGGVDFEVTAEWKHLRNERSIKMAIEWSSTPTNRIPFTEQVPTGCGKIEFGSDMDEECISCEEDPEPDNPKPTSPSIRR